MSSIYARTLRMAEIEQGYIQADAYSDSELNAGLIVTALNTAAEQGVITLVELGQDDEH